MLVAGALTTFAPPGFASPPSHVLAIRLGVPIPVSFYGYGEVEGDVDVEFVGGATLEYAGGLLADFPLYLGLWAGGAAITSRTQSLSPTLYLASAGVQLLLRWRFDVTPRDGVVVGFGAGPGVLCAGLLVDETLRKDTVAIGGRIATSLGYAWAPEWSAELVVGLELYGAPLDEATWYNKPLGDTNFLTVGAGVSWTP